jgi:hypothetical protein
MATLDDRLYYTIFDMEAGEMLEHARSEEVMAWLREAVKAEGEDCLLRVCLDGYWERDPEEAGDAVYSAELNELRALAWIVQ